MKGKVLSGLVLLSVCLNVSFVAGFLYTRRALRKLETAEGRAEWAARKLGLDEGQRRAFGELHGEWRAVLEKVQREHGAEIEAVWAEAVKENPEPEALRARLEPLLDAQRRTTVQGLEHLVRVFKVLKPAQRRALVDMIRRKDRLL